MLYNWQPIVRERQKIKDIENKLLDIDSLINNNIGMIEDPGVFSGLAGLGLYKSYMWKYFKKDGYYDETDKILNRIFDILEANADNDCSYCSGLAGIGLFVRHLAEQAIFDLAPEELLYDFNTPISTALDYCLESDNFDFLYGATGLGLYMVRNNYQHIFDTQIGRLIEALAKKSTMADSGRRLDQLEPYDPQFVGCNFGLAHGLPAIMVLLSKTIQQGIAVTDSTSLLTEFTSFIIDNRNKDSQDISAFPNFITEHAHYQDRYSRMAWCYGDMGVCSSLLQSAACRQRDDIHELAVALLQRSVQRKNADEPTPIKDPFFCHGGAGIAHMFNKAWSLTGNPLFANAALEWLGETFTFLEDKKYITGLSNAPDKMDFLNGIAGTSLVLLSMISDQPPAWDEFFLLS